MIWAVIGTLVFIFILILLKLKSRNSSQTSSSKSQNPKTKKSTQILNAEANNKLTEILQGRFKDIAVKSSEGIGIIAQAFDTKQSKKVTIKAIHPDLMDDDEAVKKFSQEMEAIKRINHPNILRVYEAESSEQLNYYITEILEGETLQDVLDRENKLSPDRALFFAKQILKALVHCHNNHIIHRDLRPENVHINIKGTVKLINFGIVKVLSDANAVMASSTVIGVADFGSPEQLQGLPITAKSDIFSLGAVIFYMLSQKLPFLNPVMALKPGAKPQSIEDYRGDLDPQVIELINNCLEMNPKERLSSMELWKKFHFMTK